MTGLAGCSAETPKMWQIGVDVLPEYRGRGIAAALVRRLAALTMARGCVPYYTAAAANVPSIRTAGAVGFVLCWAQLTAVLREKPDEGLH